MADDFITAFKKTSDFQSGDELNADMSSSTKGNPAPKSGEDVIPQIKPDVVGLGSAPQSNPGPTVDQELPAVRERFNQPLAAKPVRHRLGRKTKIIFGVAAAFFILNLVFILNIGLRTKILIADAKKLKDSVSSHDFSKVKSELKRFEKSLVGLQKSWFLISWVKPIPLLGGYVSDGERVIRAGRAGLEVADMLIEVAEPYADLIGFSGVQVQQDGQKTAADRIDFIVKTIPQILPKLDAIGGKMTKVNGEISQINPARYPVKMFGKPVRERVEMSLDLVSEATNFIKNGKPLLAQTTYLLGLDEPRTYLVLFQNDKELRPTGGFMTAYSIMKVDKAKFEPVESNDIYNLDAKYKPAIPAPAPIINHIKGPYVLSKNMRLRDLNWTPDFGEAMAVFIEESEKVGVKEIDGVIAVDTQLLVNLLEVLGPIGVPGFGNFSTETKAECNCPQVIYELESFADVEGPIVWDPAGTGKIIYAPPNYENRKKIIGPLMNSILANAWGQPKEKLPKLFEAGYKSLIEKHVLLYLLDSESQKAAEGFAVAGKISDYDGDYLHINDANLGGRKSNLYATQDVSQEISIGKDGGVEKTLTISYKNPEKQDGWLNSVLPNWVRIYVPKGSQLVSFEGVEEKEEPYEEFGKTVFAGFFELRPQGVAKVTVKYKLPFKVKNNYSLLIQKQPGTNAPLYSLHLGKKQEEFFLKADKEVKIRI